MTGKQLFITEDDCYLFGKGTHYEIYKKLGAHKVRGGYHFAVWAPHAKSVSVVGDFNDWKPDKMFPVFTSGIWECRLSSAKEGELYKYLIETKDGRMLYKADPYAYEAELRPGTASRLTAGTDKYKWSDLLWMKKRALGDPRRKPMSIYECHLGSWRKKEPDDDNGFYTYRELAPMLADYVSELGYTHVELIGISEHPYDGSWGYQVTGYYAPTSRYGSAADFAYFVNYLHKKNIGVILDWVPAHFPKDEFGLAEFDGEALYEYADPRIGEQKDWGTKVFDYSKTEVSNFLIGNALFWLNEYHIDGLRVDAVASMLYRDYGRREGEWIPNKKGGRENLEAVEFFKHLNTVIAGRGDGVVTIAEESTTWPMISHDVRKGGLGFTFKWNMGWMHDFLEYMKLDPYFRKGAHNSMTFAMTYATSENFILVLSHDEVVHLKCSMLTKMPGYYKDKFMNLKCAYTFMTGHPGKKLLFMGQEFGVEHEWDEKTELDWSLLEKDEHKEVQSFYKDLMTIYNSHPSLYELDDMWDGFEWINANDADRSIYSWIRKSRNGKKALIFVVNFTPMERSDYKVGVPKSGTYKLLLTEQGLAGDIRVRAKKGECDGTPYHLSHPLAPYGIAVYEFSY